MCDKAMAITKSTHCTCQKKHPRRPPTTPTHTSETDRRLLLSNEHTNVILTSLPLSLQITVDRALKSRPLEGAALV
jgi:hypothetical protein|eukprot:m.422481 g.422481  ORF g.422481 m.422481 type:complete len:76 (+) comp37767_c0_seq1:161-388(+)